MTVAKDRDEIKEKNVAEFFEHLERGSTMPHMDIALPKLTLFLN